MSTVNSKTKPARAKKRKLLGRYIVADPAICHGKPTFIGTRVMVWQVLEMVSEGMAWDEISRQWPEKSPKKLLPRRFRFADMISR